MIKVIDKDTKTPQITIFDGLAINLVGDDILKVTPARGLSPRKEVVVKGATQAQLQKLYNEGHPILEEVAEKQKEKEVKNAAPKEKKNEEKKDIEKTIDFNGYSYSFEFNKLLYEDKEVKFTTIENDLFRYLLNNSNNIMSTDDIHLNIWKDKKMTLFTLRNIIRSIREKTYHKLIKNVSNRGYMLVIE